MSTDLTEIEAQQQPPPSQAPATPTSAPSTTVTPPPTDATTAPTTTTPTPPPPPDSKKPPSEPDFVTIPSYSRWFRWEAIHECEVRHMPEFFDGRSPSKNPKVYKYYRNSIIKHYRSTTSNSKKITFTEVRRTIVGDVGSIRRVFDFLETWGLVNYSPPSSKQPFRWENSKEKEDNNKDTKSTTFSSTNNAAAAAAALQAATSTTTTESSPSSIITEKSKKYCSGCKSLCTIACFVSDKYDLVLCARCYVRGTYRVGVNSSEFRRVEISEPVKTDWTDKETLHLLEAIMHYGDDWKRVAEHVGGRTEKDCVARFIKLPFGEQFVEPTDQGDDDSSTSQTKDQADAESGLEPSAKRRNLTPLADTSNPIMAQAAFLSALAGVEVSEAAAHAAVATLYDMDHLTSRGSVQSLTPSAGEQGPSVASNGDPSLCAPEEIRADVESLLKQEEDEFLQSISAIIEGQMKGILGKMSHYEQMELQLEGERHHMQQMKHQLFLDQLSLLFHKAAAPKSAENVVEGNPRTELTTSS